VINSRRATSVFLCVVLSGLFIQESHSADALVHDFAYGYSIAMPDFPKQVDAGVSVTPLSFSGPLDDGKAPSCNVQIQNTGWSLATFRTQSLGQFKALGLSLDSESPRKVSGKDALLFVSSGHDLKMLSLAVQVGQAIYLVTCVSPVNQFPKYEKTFQHMMDSFSLN
jgi:hypothetical protein